MTIRRILLCVAIILSSVLLLPHCGSKRHVWKEEVKLQSGELLTVQRDVQFKFYQPAGGGGGTDILESSLEIISPVRTDWPARWDHPPFLPLIFDRDSDNQEWFVVATFSTCTAWYDLGKPKLPYTEFRFRNFKWIQQPLSDKFIGYEGNMLVPDVKNVNRDHTLDSKKKDHAIATISPEYKNVVSVWKHGC